MYRNNTWEKGFYILNMDKWKCSVCGKDFIIGRELIQENPACPYCKSSDTSWESGTNHEQLEELVSDMGCLAIYKEDLNVYQQNEEFLTFDSIQKCVLRYSSEHGVNEELVDKMKNLLKRIEVKINILQGVDEEQELPFN